MSTTIAELNIKLDADTSRAVTNLGNANKGFKEMATQAEGADKKSAGLVGSLMGMVNPLGLAVAGVGLLTGGLGAAAKSAADEQRNIDRLNGALKNSVPNWDGNTEAIEGYIKKQQALAFGDDDLRASLALLVTATGDVTQAQQLQTDAMNLARFGNISLEQATKLMLKADDESYKALGKLGIQIDKNATKEEALAAIRQASAGQAETYANSAAGSMERIQGAFGDAVEDIGAVVLPKITEALSGIANFISSPGFQQGFQAFITLLTDGIGGAINFISGVIDTVGPFLQPFIDAWGDFFGNLSEGKGILESIGELIGGLGEALMEGLGKIGESIGEWVTGGGLEAFTDNIGTWAEALWEWVQRDAIPGLMTALGKLGEAVWGWITGGGLQGLVSNLVTWGGAILGFIAKDVLPFLGQKLLDLGKFIWDWITGGGLTSLISNLVTWGGAFLGWIAKDVLPFIGQKLGELGAAIWDWISATAQGLVTELGKFATAFWTWITGENGVVAGIGAKLAEIWNGITGWVQTTATNIVTEVIKIRDGFWSWITDIVQNIPTKLGEVWTGITTWIGTTVTSMGTEALKIGEAMLNGIVEGVKGLGEALWNFIKGVAESVWNSIVGFFTGQTPPASPTVPGGPPPPPTGGTPPSSPPRPPDPRYGPRAEGGGVWAGGTYLVGERGPEMFVPRMSGSIIPNHALGGDTFQVTIHAGIGSDPHVIGQVVTQAISRSLSLRQRSKGYR